MIAVSTFVAESWYQFDWLWHGCHRWDPDT